MERKLGGVMPDRLQLKLYPDLYLLSVDCKKKRGCGLCLYVVRKGFELTKKEETFPAIIRESKQNDVSCTGIRVCCKHSECPYHELDGFKSYKEYERKSGSISIDSLMAEINRQAMEAVKERRR